METFWLFTSKSTRILPGASGTLPLLAPFPRLEKIFGSDRNVTEADPGSVLDGVDDRRRCAVQRQLAGSLRSAWSALVAIFLEVNADRRHIHGCRNHVVGHLAVQHSSVAPNHIFVQR